MRTIVEPARTTPVAEDYDVIVAGGGTAGVLAAIAAARNGARTLLVERSGFLGGHIASQLLEHSAGWHDAGGRRIVAGMPEELVERLVVQGASPGHVNDDTGYTRSRVPMNHEEFKSIVTLMVDEAGADFLVHTPVVDVLRGPDGGTAGLVVSNKSGRQAYGARVVVDCTGDADVAALAGAPFHPLGREADGLTQPVSLLFKIGGIDHAALLHHVREHPGDFRMGIDPAALEGRSHVNLWGFGTLLQRAHADGVLSLSRNEMHVSCWVDSGEAVINVTRCTADGTDARALSRAEVVLRRQVLEFVRFFRAYVPGCGRAHLSATASCVGVRETRRIRGLCELTYEDVKAGRRFPDAVVQGGFPIDSHDPRGNSMEEAEHVSSAYDIPFRCMVPAQPRGLIVAGRCISADRRALASARITGTCMAMGQAAGTAAALCARDGKAPAELDVASLQRTLLAQGVLLARG